MSAEAHTELRTGVITINSLCMSAWKCPGLERRNGYLPGIDGALNVTTQTSFRGIFGQRVRLNDDTFVVADDQYLRDSILHAKKQVIAGYLPFMPDYSSVIPKPDVQELIVYLKSQIQGSAP